GLADRANHPGECWRAAHSARCGEALVHGRLTAPAMVEHIAGAHRLRPAAPPWLERLQAQAEVAAQRGEAACIGGGEEFWGEPEHGVQPALRLRSRGPDILPAGFRDEFAEGRDDLFDLFPVGVLDAVGG